VRTEDERPALPDHAVERPRLLEDREALMHRHVLVAGSQDRHARCPEIRLESAEARRGTPG
jgi:hypothetical protein